VDIVDYFNRSNTRPVIVGFTQRRESGLKSGGSCIRVNTISIFPGRFPINFDFFHAISPKKFGFSGKFSENFDFFRQIVENFRFFQAILKEFQFSKQKLLI